MDNAGLESSIKPPRRRWRIAWLLGLGVLVNYFDRVNLSVSHASLYAAFGISNITFGYLSGAYNWTYALCQLPIGVLLDKLGVKRIGRISTFLWSIASFGAAVSTSVGGLFGRRLAAGRGRSAHLSGECKSHRPLVPRKRTQLCDIDLRRGGKIRFGHRRSAHRNRA